MKPLHTDDPHNPWSWYRHDPDLKVPDGATHWLPPAVFDKLTGGVLSPFMGIREYPSEEAAMEALK